MYTSSYPRSAEKSVIHPKHRWEEKVATGKVRRVNVTLTEEVIGLVNRAITGGRYGSASEYVRALIVSERRKSGDRKADRVSPKVRMGRPRAA